MSRFTHISKLSPYAGSFSDIQRIPQILQFPVVIHAGGGSALNLQSSQYLYLFGSRVAAEGAIFEKFFKTSLKVDVLLGFPFHEFDGYDMSVSECTVQNYFQSEALEIDIPSV